VARIITSTLNIDEVYEKFALEVKKLVDFDRMNVNLIDELSLELIEQVDRIEPAWKNWNQV